MKIKFGGADTRSIKMLNSFPHGLFISEFVNNRDEKIHRFLCKNYLENGAALFGRESSDEMNDFRKVVGGALLNQMVKASDMLPNNPYPRANLERQIGEILLAKGRDEEAIKHLDKAMSINPKVGVKKLLYKLKEK